MDTSSPIARVIIQKYIEGNRWKDLSDKIDNSPLSQNAYRSKYSPLVSTLQGFMSGFANEKARQYESQKRPELLAELKSLEEEQRKTKLAELREKEELKGEIQRKNYQSMTPLQAERQSALESAILPFYSKKLNMQTSQAINQAKRLAELEAPRLMAERLKKEAETKNEIEAKALARIQSLPTYKRVGVLESNYNTLSERVDGNKAVDDIAFVNLFQKSLDDAGAVLEGEQKNVKGAGGLRSRIYNLKGFIAGGGELSPEIRKQMLDVVGGLKAQAINQLYKDVKPFIYRAKRDGLDLKAMGDIRSLIIRYEQEQEAQKRMRQRSLLSQAKMRKALKALTVR